MERVILVKKFVKDLELGDVVARSSNPITRLEFIPIHEIRKNSDGRIMFVQKSKNGVTLMGDEDVWVLENFAKMMEK